MGQTIVEKIFSKTVGRNVVPGEYVEVSSRLPMVGGPRGASPRIFETKLANPELTYLVDGHTGSTASHNAGEGRARNRRWAKAHGVPMENVFDLGRAGVEHVTAGERAWAIPGELFFESNNGHTTTLGALGAFAVTMSYGSAGYMVTGKTWIKVPETVKVIVKGKLPKGVVGRDVNEYVLGQLGPSGAVGKVMEWTGPVIDEMSIEGRFSICCHALFFGAWTAIMAPDQKCIDYVKAKNPNASFEPQYSDADANYAKVVEFDLSNLSPQIAPPPDRCNVVPVEQIMGRPINRAFVGSCSNSRIEDMRAVAQVLQGRKIHPEVILNITPGTPGILKQCVQEGLMETFIDAEAAVHYPACGQCWGANTPLAAGDVCVATSTCNYPGRMGSKEAEIYLASPATAAASALEGKIADPRKYL